MPPDQRIPLGVAPLSALDLPVLTFVRAAAEAGFDAVGLRAHPVSRMDPVFSLDTASRSFRDLQGLVADTGLEVLDLEVFTIHPGVERAQWMPVLEAGARLGARYLNVVGGHPSLEAFEQVVGRLTADALDHGIMPVLEPVAYRQLNDFRQAIRIARAVGCAVEMDVLHFLRTGASLETVSVHRDLFPILQLCDAPASLRDHGEALTTLAAARGEDDLAVTESRGLRLLPGDGDGPVHELLALLGPSTRISVEIPNVRMRGGLSGERYLAFLHDAARAFLASSG